MDTWWSFEDKKKLLMALRKYGTDNIFEVQKVLPHKTVSELRMAFEKYSRLAHDRMNDTKKSEEDESAIDQWVSLLKKTQVKRNSVYDIIPRVLKYIALFEKRPLDKDVNLSDCYMALSEMSNGMVSKRLNPTTSYFFYGNLSRLAHHIKNNNSEKKRKFVRDMKNFDHIFKSHLVKTYNKNKKKKVNDVLNPLNVPAELLNVNEKSIPENV